MTVQDIDQAQRAYLVGAMIFVLITTTTKISILLYYRRIFATQKLKRNTVIIGVLTAFVWLTSELGFLLKCLPLKSSWDPLIAGHHMNFNVFVLVIGIMDLLLDISVLCLPMSMIPGLKLSLRHRINISVIFLLGGL